MSTSLLRGGEELELRTELLMDRDWTRKTLRRDDRQREHIKPDILGSNGEQCYQLLLASSAIGR